MSLENLHITLHAGSHDRHDCPLRFPFPIPFPEGFWQLRSPEGTILPLQRLDNNEVALCIPEMASGSSDTYALEQAPSPVEPQASVQSEPDAGSVLMALRGAIVTRYHYDGVPARPYFHPLLMHGELPLTRAYPMQKDIPGETQDHPHHRSLWIAHGEVNHTDNWSEERGHGYTVHQSLDRCFSGPVCGSFATTSIWTTADHNLLLNQQLEVTLWATHETIRMLDFVITLQALQEEVFFGDTKEGGILSVRVASDLDVPRTGRIENVYGGVNEAETWGKPAHWCDYSGRLAGQHVGLAIMDHPLSFRAPTHWHVRNYGLMTANPFGYSAFTQGAKNGSHRLLAGESLTFRYRLLMHPGDATMGRVNAHYLDFVAPPTVEISA